MPSLGQNTPSKTNRQSLNVDQQAIESLEAVMPEVFNLRQYSSPVKFTTLLTAKDDDSAMEDYKAQNKELTLPWFIIRRRSVAPAADYLNPFVAQKYGKKIGVTEDRQHAITIFPVKVVYQMEVSLYTDDYYILDHWIRSLAMYCRNEIMLGYVEMEDPKFNFEIKAKFGDNYDYPDFADHSSFRGFVYTTQFDMSTFLVDLEMIPTLAQIIFDPVVVEDQYYADVVKQLTENAGQSPDTEIQKEVSYVPSLRYVVNLRDKITNPAERD
jgi:hypothetical protein